MCLKWSISILHMEKLIYMTIAQFFPNIDCDHFRNIYTSFYETNDLYLYVIVNSLFDRLSHTVLDQKIHYNFQQRHRFVNK